ncbi:hypothetical protein CRENBAI_010216 [Crenichthys baileyi]|uniref:Uncharacterized protein n=1 Tax=Crenichthys baileyi TaxID=28760 RepID=A0AAV9RK82_9TELE
MIPQESPLWAELSYGSDKIRSTTALNAICDDLQALQHENWITLSPETTCRANKILSDTWMANTGDPYLYRDSVTSPGGYSDMEAAAPPIPPRTSSWNLSSSNPDTEIHIAESPLPTVRKCHSPCVLLDRKCNSPSIVRKFKAMLQENKGKVFKEGVLTSRSINSSSNCNTGCCHNSWSCDASKLQTVMPSLKGSRRNLMLERKTAKFNRTVSG